MSDDVAMTVQFGADEAFVEFPSERVTVSVPLTRVGERLYRLDGVPVFAESAAFGDIIEAETAEGGRLRFVRVAERGGWRTFDYIFPAHKLDGDRAQALLAELTARGGHWERVFGGLLFVCVPPGLELDPSAWVDTI
jgi:hypothetical protein